MKENGCPIRCSPKIVDFGCQAQFTGEVTSIRSIVVIMVYFAFHEVMYLELKPTIGIFDEKRVCLCEYVGSEVRERESVCLYLFSWLN